jgi:hypothetical protein
MSDMSVVTEAASIQARLQSAGELAELLAAAWDAFDLMLAICQDCEERSTELFAAFAFAAAAAVQGRSILDFAPAPATTANMQTSAGAGVHADLDHVADSIADLAHALADHLLSATRLANDPGDRQVCEDAAAQAWRIYQLLAPGR